MSLPPSAAQLIETLQLRPLPREGGYYRETYRSERRLPAHAGERSLATAIYYLLTPDTVSALHRLPADELFHFYAGDPVEMLLLNPPGSDPAGRWVVLGPDVLAGQTPQVLVPAGVWQGSVLRPGGRYALLGTTMAPGFAFADYEAGDARQLTASYPTFARWIERLCPH
ncbi:MAG TPA: cupin domain-containing protein [Gemmataceae bacterium]|nr:cupin domain-containing protein [Gemmataceae bacterium]